LEKWKFDRRFIMGYIYSLDEIYDGLNAVTHNSILRSIEHFNNEYPNTNMYPNTKGKKGWIENQNYLYAIEYKGKLYPPKYIMSLATRLPINCIYGGWGTYGVNSYLEIKGFKIIDK
jgi:hypothetical protein